MKVTTHTSKLVRPYYEGSPPNTTSLIPLTVFDNVSYDCHMAVVYAYRPPTPPNASLELGLRKALSHYRELSGRLSINSNGLRAILLNDAGARFVEATTDSSLDQLGMPLKPSPALLSLHPSLKGIEELIQVQLTRFSCGSLVVGYTAHHLVADGCSISNFLAAWGRACRGYDIRRISTRERDVLFMPRSPPNFEFEHRGVEFKSRKAYECAPLDDTNEDVVVHKAHFTFDFLAKLKDKASESPLGSGKSNYTRFESLVAHLWRTITRARALRAHETTCLRISVDGRSRMNPRVPNDYFGNLVLWAFPRARAKDLVREPLSYAAELIHEAVVKVNDRYLRSFIDFASTMAVEEDLVGTAEMGKSVLCPNMEVDSWLRFPFYELEFGGGCKPCAFMPSFFPTEGMMFLLPSFIGDGSVDAFLPLFQNNLSAFKNLCYNID